jgi:FAD/FMN-containing dehydrogenase/Fe-S oxidoreductase
MTTHEPHTNRITPDVRTDQLLRSKRAASPAANGSHVDVPALVRQLRRTIEGEVLSDAGGLALYAQDASNYFHVPLGVVLPRTRADVIAAVAACREFDAPIVCRTAGTALAGQTCNEAIVLDFSRHLNRILELDPRARRARVEPGVICDDLVHAAAPYGLGWGPKPATHNRCCFGGMLANNCGGMEAQIHGTAVHNVEALEVLLYDGTILKLGWLNEAELAAKAQRSDREGEIYRALLALRSRTESSVRQRFPKIPRRISGYNLDQLSPDDTGRVNLARSLVGSEGTCAIILEATLQLIPLPPHVSVLAVGFNDVFEAADAVPTVLKFKPLVCEGLDQRLVDHVRTKHMRQERDLGLLPDGKGWLLVKLGGESVEQAHSRAQALESALREGKPAALDARVIEDSEQLTKLWHVRESGLGATAFVPGEADSWPGWEDSAVAPERLGAYLRDMNALFQRYGYAPALYGHFGQGLLHCRVQFDLVDAKGIEAYRAFLTEAAVLCTQKHGGSLSGEHGDGQARAELLEIMFGRELVEAFGEFKRIWDPRDKLNPGRVVNPRPFTADLRIGAAYDPAQPQTHFAFQDDRGSFARATLRCVGVGLCRREHVETEHDVMCPSFMATREEQHSTRGRAHLLWEMMRGEGSPITGGVRDIHVKRSLDLCLACKGCKSDCPVNVDMATYKAEFLARYYQHRLRPRYAYAFGLIDKWARLGAPIARFANWVTHAKWTSSLVKFVVGMAPEREVPRFSNETFVAWFRRRAVGPKRSRRVVLWPDTFNNHFHASTARAATEVLEAAGYEVLVPSEAVCCGRPLYDYGFLHMARRYLERTLEVLGPWLEEGLPIVVLEPSCASVFRDELPNLMPGRVQAQRLCKQTKLLSELLTEDAIQLPKLKRRAIVQGHCHHKSVLGIDAERAVFRGMGLSAEMLASGCCGMAGAFGFERDAAKQHVSKACGERVLFQAVRNAAPDTLVLADGFSCRTQIAQGTGREALHLADALKLALAQGQPGSDGFGKRRDV